MKGLSSRNRRPKFSPTVKILDQHREWVRELRTRRLGPRRIQSELPRRTAANSLLFLERVIEEMPFPTQVIQTRQSGAAEMPP
jgi:hypothetical protein